MRMSSGFRYVSRREGGILRGGELLRAPYGLEIIESCLSCPHREDRLFCNLSPPAVQKLAAITSAAAYPKGAILFVEGQSPRGVFILCSGRVKFTADVIESTQSNFIRREDFLHFLREHGEAALRVAQQLGETYHSAIAEMRTIGLSHSAAEKLARFLLDLSADHAEEKGEIRLTLTLTHEEIAQMIGSSRETVTRLFADFKKKEFLQVKGSTLILKNKAGLESVLGA